MATVSPQFYDRVYQRSTATGNGATFLLGDTVKGYLTFKDAIGLNVNFEYVIEAIDRLGVPTGVFEVGLGKITQSGNNYYLNRTTVYKTSDLQNPTTRINFGAGDKNVWCDVPAKRFNEYQDTLNSAVSSAATSASNAATSESNALSYKNAANTANNNAQSAKTAAQTAQSAAESAKTAAQSAQTAAETAKNQAVSARGDALSYKNAAETARNGAQTSATNAAESETNAQTYMQQASGFASNANTAKTAAESAKTAAQTANNNAQSAKTAAQSAQSAAESAQSAAESANSSAQSAKTAAQQSADRAETIRQAIMTAGGASAVAGTGIQIGELNTSNMTYTVSVKNEYLKLTGGTLTGNLTFSAGKRIYVENNIINQSNTSSSNREFSVLDVRRNPSDTTNSSGGVAQLWLSQPLNNKNLMISWRVSNPRAGNLPTATAISGEKLTANTANCYDWNGLYYYYDLNKAFPYASQTPPLKGGSQNYYRGNHLVTHANLEHFLTRDGDANYPLTSAIYSTTNDVIKRNVDNAHTTIFGGTAYANGGSVMLIGKSQETNAGGFQLRATLDGTTTRNLLGLPSGLLRWDGLANSINSTFRLTGSAANYAIQIQSNAITKGTKPGASVNSSLEFYGKTLSKWQNRLGHVGNIVDTNNNNRVIISAYGLSSAEDTAASQVEAWWRPNSDFVEGYERFAQCADPELMTYADSKIATTRWVRQAILRQHLGIAKGAMPTGNTYLERNLADNYGTSIVSYNSQTSTRHYGTDIADYSPAHRFGGYGTALIKPNNDTTHSHVESFLRSYWNIAGDTASVGICVKTITAHNSNGVGTTKESHHLLLENCNNIYKNVDNGYTYFCAGTNTSNGAHLCLCGKDHNNKGKFWLRAQDGTNSVTLEGQATGTRNLFWDGYRVLTEGKKNDLVKGTNPSSTFWDLSLKTFDNAGTETKNRLHEIRSYVDSNGKSGVELLAYNFKANDASYVTLAIVKEKDGVSYATCPTPATSANDTKIATTAWVRTHCSSVAGGYLPLSGGTLSGDINLKRTDYTSGTAPTSNNFTFVRMQDKDGKSLGKLQFGRYTDGGLQTHLVVNRPDTNAENVFLRGTSTANGVFSILLNTGRNDGNSFTLNGRPIINWLNSSVTKYVSKDGAGTKDGSSAANAMSLNDMRWYLQTLQLSSSTDDFNGSYTLTLAFVPLANNASYGAVSFDTNKIPGVRNLVVTTSTGTNGTLSNYTTNCPRFTSIAVNGSPLNVTLKNIRVDGTVGVYWGAQVHVNTFISAAKFYAYNFARMDIESGIFNIVNANTDHAFIANEGGTIYIQTDTAQINFSGQCYYTNSIFGSRMRSNAVVRYDRIKFTGTKPVVIFQASGTATATCETAAGTAAKTAALSGFTLATNATAKVKFTVTNTAANPTLNINGTGAKTLRWKGANVPAGMLFANSVYDVKYDGTYWVIQQDGNRVETLDNFSVIRRWGNHETTYNSGSFNFSGWALYMSGYNNGVLHQNAVTPDAGDNSTKIATTAFVQSAILSGVPVGTVVHYQGTTLPANWLRCNGAKNLSRTTYAKLYAVLGTTYGSNDNNTFGVPDYRNRTAWGGASDTDRGYLNAGLPNITGYMKGGKYFGEYGGRDNTSADWNTGALYATQGSASGGHDSAGNSIDINFNASKSNSIYGSSTTVQPPAVKGMFIIKYQ